MHHPVKLEPNISCTEGRSSSDSTRYRI